MKNEKIYRIVSIAGAFLLWSSWAYFINESTLQQRILSAVAQGTLSALATSLMIKSLKSLSATFNIFIIPSLIVTLFTTVAGITIHTLIDTPHIFRTLLPAVSVAFIYSLLTSYQFHKNVSMEKTNV